MNNDQLCALYAALDTIARLNKTCKSSTEWNLREANRIAVQAWGLYEKLCEGFLENYTGTRDFPLITEQVLDIIEYLQGLTSAVEFGMPGRPAVRLTPPKNDSGETHFNVEFTCVVEEQREALKQAWAEVLKDLYLPGIDPHRLNCDAIEAQPINVNGWAHADTGNSEGYQEYELVYPARLDVNEDEISEWSARECIAWLVDYDFNGVVQELNEMEPPRPVPPGSDGIINIANIESLSVEQCHLWLQQVDEDLDSNDAHALRHGVLDTWERLYGNWEIECQNMVINHLDEARELWERDNEPMMNYFYPLPDLGSSDAEKLNGGCLMAVVLQPQEKTALVLSGGGMDLSDQIIEAHVRLGYYPPTHFRLPKMAGELLNQRNRTLIAACRESACIQRQWLTNKLRGINDFADYCINNMMKETT